MIRHIVLVKFREDVDQSQKDALFAALDGLRGHLKGVRDFVHGPNVSVETDLIRGNHEGFWFDFDDVASRDAYLVDADHQAVGAQIVAATVGGIEGVTVFDIALPD